MKKVFVLFLLIALVAGSVYEPVKLEDSNEESEQVLEKKEWWENSVFYQIYPRSYKDSNNDGVGDLKGIIQKLGHLKYLGVNAVWLSPIFKSPMVDFGYDIQDYYQVDPIFGTNDDLDRLILECKRVGIKLFLDFVPNHTSDQHEWFVKSQDREPGFEDYYVWHDGITNPEGGQNLPPNNWRSVFTIPAWTWNEKRQQYYLHQFAAEQPDVNFRNPRVVAEFKDFLNYYLEKGIDGFRIDAINYAFEDPEFKDDILKPGGDPNIWDDYEHIHTRDLPESYELVYDWRDLSDTYYLLREIEPKVLLTEAYTETLNQTMEWFRQDDRVGSHIAFNFKLIVNLDRGSSAADFANEIQEWIGNLPEGAVSNWVLGNHDRARVAYRYGEERIDQMAILQLTLPGIAVIYYGEEIGMTDNRDITWEETKDPQACNTNSSVFQDVSRDPCRTPFQWDNTANAGFNEGGDTWLPVHQDYTKVNLKAQQETNETSTFKLYQQLIKLRQNPAFTHGNFRMKAINEDKVLVYSRHNNEFVVVINFSDEEAHVDLRQFDPEICCDAQLTLANRAFKHAEHVSLRDLLMDPNDAVILRVSSDASLATFSIGAMLLVFVVKFFV